MATEIIFFQERHSDNCQHLRGGCLRDLKQKINVSTVAAARKSFPRSTAKMSNVQVSIFSISCCPACTTFGSAPAELTSSSEGRFTAAARTRRASAAFHLVEESVVDAATGWSSFSAVDIRVAGVMARMHRRTRLVRRSAVRIFFVQSDCQQDVENNDGYAQSVKQQGAREGV